MLNVSLLLVTTLLPADAPTLPPPTGRDVDYQRYIKPILAGACVGCPGPEKQRGGLRLDSRAEALRGGNSGPVLDPGHAERSRLLRVVAGLDPEVSMPPKGKPPLTREEIGHLR